MSKLCQVCGEPIRGKGSMYCSHACAGKARQNYRVCTVCGEKFAVSPSANKKTCGKPDCVAKHRKEVSRLPQVVESLGTGRAAYQATPKGSKGPDFHLSKNWKIQAPDGTIYEVHNLLDWLREHEDMLDGTARQAWDGISKIKYYEQGTRKHPTKQWKGWRLLGWSEE